MSRCRGGWCGRMDLYAVSGAVSRYMNPRDPKSYYWLVGRIPGPAVATPCSPRDACQPREGRTLQHPHCMPRKIQCVAIKLPSQRMRILLHNPKRSTQRTLGVCIKCDRRCLALQQPVQGATTTTARDSSVHLQLSTPGGIHTGWIIHRPTPFV